MLKVNMHFLIDWGGGYWVTGGYFVQKINCNFIL